VVPVTGRPWLRRVAVTLVLVTGCAANTAPRPADMSGFLDDYSRLRKGPPDGVTLAYRNPSADWAAYDKILFEPVTIWRSGKHSLDDIPEADLQRLAAEFQRAVLLRLAPDYQLVKERGPGVMRVRLAITVARQSDRVLDVFTFDVPPDQPVPDTQELTPALRAFVMGASIEGELTDSVSGTVLAEGVDRRGDRRGLDTWGEVRAALDRWAAWLAGRLRRARAGQLR
jgi:hypothetical protein